MFGSGIFYSYKSVFLVEHRDYFLMNPIANLIANYRMVLMENVMPMVNSLLVIGTASIVTILLMTWVMKWHSNTLTRLALE